MKNTFVAHEFVTHRFCRAEYLSHKYVTVFPELTSFDIMVIKTYCYLSDMRAEIAERRALVIDEKNDIGYIVQKGPKGLFLYSNKYRQKLYIDLNSILTELVLTSGINKTLDILSGYLSDGIMKTKIEGSEILFLYEKAKVQTV